MPIARVSDDTKKDHGKQPEQGGGKTIWVLTRGSICHFRHENEKEPTALVWAQFYERPTILMG